MDGPAYISEADERFYCYFGEILKPLSFHECASAADTSAADTSAADTSGTPAADTSVADIDYISEADEYFYCLQSAGVPDVVLIGGTKDIFRELQVFYSCHMMYA